jgi:hypothetical protein
LSLNQQKTVFSCRQKLLSDKQIKFKEFFVSWNKFHKNRPRDSFKTFFGKNVVYMKYIIKNRRWRILMSMDCIWWPSGLLLVNGWLSHLVFSIIESSYNVTIMFIEVRFSNMVATGGITSGSRIQLYCDDHVYCW